MPTAHIQVVLEDQCVPKSLETALRRVGAAASFWSLSDTLRLGLSASADAVVVVAPSDRPGSDDRLRSLFDRMADHPRATLVLRPEAHPRPRTSHPPTLPVSFGAALDADELAVRLATMIEMRDSLELLHGARGADRSQEPTVAQAYLKQMRLASQIQRELLPDVLPHYGPISFSVIYRPAEYVSGDIYDIQTLDEEHVAIGLADVTGHGVPAALLTVFLKRAWRGRGRRDGGDHLLHPDQVLDRLNHEILEVNFSECSFAALVYAVLNTRTLQLQVARAGAPYPTLRRADGSLRLLRPAGMLIGVLPEAAFAVESVQLRPGDSLLLYTDGLDRLILPARRLPGPTEAPAAVTGVRPREDGNGDRGVVRPRPRPRARGNDDSGLWEPAEAATAVAVEPAGVPQHAASRPRAQPNSGNGDGSSTGAERAARPPCHPAQTAGLATSDTTVPPDQIITQSAWYALLREQGEQAALEHISFRHDLLRRIGHPLDDLTVLALQVNS
ncbi:MAG TPA: SpoIIE family protein phosphatase [Phycisphaerae bacterium]|nr:SpoIIE family protein phosphatase [Phycisphaerae bacterium]